MKESKNKKASAENPKKKTRKQIEQKLEDALSNLRPILGKKKFKRRIKKAGKVIASGVKNFKSNGTPKTKKERPAAIEIKNESVQ